MSKLDSLDIKILQLLQKDARITHKELATQLGPSTTPVFERVKKLERKGYIKHYAAVLDYEKLGFGLVVFILVKMQVHDNAHIEQLIREVKKLEEVVECYHITGEHDYLLKIVIEDMNAYQKFIRNKLSAIPGIVHLNSSIVMSIEKNENTLRILSKE